MKIDKSKLRVPDNTNEKWWFTTIKALIDEAEFGTIEVKLTIAKGEVKTVKNTTTKSFSFNN